MEAIEMAVVFSPQPSNGFYDSEALDSTSVLRNIECVADHESSPRDPVCCVCLRAFLDPRVNNPEYMRRFILLPGDAWRSDHKLFPPARSGRWLCWGCLLGGAKKKKTHALQAELRS